MKIDKIKDIQNILYEILCYFDNFCSENKIKYFLSNGTLLGAAKYRGFIPWDDDIDVLMPREDYDKLMHLSTINNGKYRLLCREQVAEWRMPYAKLSCEDTIIQEGDYNFGIPFGLSVDIFPIDNWNSNLCIAKMQAFCSECLKRMLICSIGGEFFTKKTGIKRLILKLIWKAGKMIGHEKLQHYMLKKTKKIKKGKYAGCRAWTCHLGREIFPSEYFSETEFLYFREKTFPAIANYKAYLSSLYGNWEEELPIDRQCSNHEIRVWYKDAD